MKYPPPWTSAIVSRMHANRISRKMVAARLGYSQAYLGMILNGERSPAAAEATIMKAVNELIEESEDHAAR